MRPSSTIDTWSQQSHRWNQVGSPTRPSADDIHLFRQFAFPIFSDNKNKNVVVLGVTPELVTLPWPSQTNLRAYDISPNMIERVWIQPKHIPSAVYKSDWRNLPLPDRSVDLVIGDGILTAAGDLEAVSEIIEEICRVLTVNGRIVLRSFIRPETKEYPTHIANLALSGKIKNFGSLKWKLAMSLVDENTSEVGPAYIHEIFSDIFSDLRQLQQCSGWLPEEINTINSYKEMPGSFFFPTANQLENIFSKHTKILGTSFGSYELSERCPIMKLSLR